MMLSWIDTLIQGALLGGLYALFALGQALVFGVMRLTNTAHGDLMILGAFVASSLANALGGNPFRGAFMRLPLAFGFGDALQRFPLNRTLGRDPLPSLVVTFGLSIVIQNLLQELFTADPRSIDSMGLNLKSVPLFEGISVGLLPLIIFVLALLTTAFLQWVLGYTALGRAFRAVSDDREVAQLMGLRAPHIYALATAIAFVLIAVAGVFQGMRTTVAPSNGPSLLLYGFEAVIIGGLG